MIKRKAFPQCLDCKVDLKDYRSKRCRRCSRLGKNNPMFDKKRSLESRIKTSTANKGKTSWIKGKHHSEETKKKMSYIHKKRVMEGKNNMWKGGIYPYNLSQRVKFRQKYQKIVFERDGYTCQICGVKNRPLQVDHIQSWAEYIELRFCLDNCRTLCVDCHYKITFGRPMINKNMPWGQNFKHLQRRVEKFAA